MSATSPETQPSQYGSTINAAQRPTTNANGGVSSFFVKERDRLVHEIAQGIETLLSSSNALNRKLEESISVGKEFEPIAGLWGRFSELMTASGIPDPNQQQQHHHPQQQQQQNEKAPKSTASSSTPSSLSKPEVNSASQSHQPTRSRGQPEPNDPLLDTPGALASSKSAAAATAIGLEESNLPPGVAPGGGTIYGQN
ncbi:hypothetical protein IE53DRAFT_339039 [Violaceomyces palustris]|uniref:Uncharacterized protein n=1 Tax=Violaceomyces palustris TaxID=1673888 RepID=A0ACD0P596_9BASI|nr:hypothetical protein IE53DRAFT_339039 [Violaceomyces palustris]